MGKKCTSNFRWWLHCFPKLMWRKFVITVQDALIHLMDVLSWFRLESFGKSRKKKLLDERRTLKSSLRLNWTLTSIKFQLDDNRVSLRTQNSFADKIQHWICCDVCCKLFSINEIYSKVRSFFQAHQHQQQ